MNEITVDPQEVVVWLAFSDGWKKASGFVVTIQGIIRDFFDFEDGQDNIFCDEYCLANSLFAEKICLEEEDAE